MLRRASFHSSASCLVRTPGAIKNDLKTARKLEQRGFDVWLQNEGSSYRLPKDPERIVKSERFLKPGKVGFMINDKPFPLNPFFKPKPPISDKTRDDIYLAYFDDPVVNTTRHLAQSYGLSIARIRAILRLKAMQSKWASSPPATYPVVQTHLSRYMDILLQSVNLKRPAIAFLKPREKIRPLDTQSYKPFFQIINDSDTFTPSDAAMILAIEPFENVQLRLDRAADRVFTMNAPEHSLSSSNQQPLTEACLQKPRHQFWITDVGSVKDKKLFVKELDGGPLREASSAERWWKRNHKHKYAHNK